MMGVSWVNILMGLVIKEYHFLVQAGAGVAMLCFVVLWMLWGLGVVDASPIVRSDRINEGDAREGLMTNMANEFALDDFDEPSEGEEETERSKADHK